jgi:hypothetical protein
VNLNFTANGELRYRGADAAGYTPIGSYAEFQLLNTYGYAPVNKYRQEADLDLLGSLDGGQTWTGQRWEPIRDNTQEMYDRFDAQAFSFHGIYDGAGHAIRGLWVDNPGAGQYQGLFGSVAGGTLENIRIESGLVQGYGFDYTAGVVAYAKANTNITNCSNNARVAGGDHTAGGVAGVLQANHITDCYNSGAVSANNEVGGLVGYVDNVYVSGCYNSGEVNGNGWYVGGLVGWSNQSSIYASYNIGEVTGGDYEVAGVVGRMYGGYIANSYNSGTVTGSIIVGGILGWTSATGPELGIKECYNSGEINGSSHVGGLAGYGKIAITASYNTGTVNGSSGVGGLAGGNGVSIIACYNTGAVRGSNNVGGLAGYGTGITITDSYWLYNSSADASTGIGSGSDEGCTRFGDGSGGTSWPVACNPFEGPFTEWWVENEEEPGPFMSHWKTLGAWNGGGTPPGAASTFPKLLWED